MRGPPEQHAPGVVRDVVRETVAHPTQPDLPRAALVHLRQVVVRDQIVGRRVPQVVAALPPLDVRAHVVDIIADDAVVMAAVERDAARRSLSVQPPMVL